MKQALAIPAEGETALPSRQAGAQRGRPLAVSIQGDQAKTYQHLPMIHIVFGNLDAWLLGTHHGVSSKHLQGYLNEFVFRFNRRFWPMVAFDSVLKIAARTKAPTYAALYHGI